MKRPYLLFLLLWGLLMVHQTARADDEVVFEETFAQNDKTGGRDKTFTNNASEVCVADNEGWTFTKCNKAYQCAKFGTASVNGVATTPHISLKTGSTATLTFAAAGWDDNKNNTLTITAEGCTVSGDISIKLNRAQWKEDYTVTISDITAPVVITFTGKRGFLDDVKIVGEKGGEIVVTVPEPKLTDEFTFWSNTVEPTKRIVTITPADDTRTRYTLDGSEPSLTEGTEITAATSLFIWGTTTVKAISTKSTYTSNVVTKTYTLGQPVNSLAEFSALADGAEAKLFLNAEQNARITDVSNKQFTVKDGAGTTLLFDFGDVAFNPMPAANQHIAGWIIGKKQTIDTKVAFVATGNTTPKYMAFANRVTEPDVTSVKGITTKETTAETYYTLSGIRVKAPKKGLYIANGKKLIIH